MVTPFVAKKHREAKDREQYLESLGHDPIYAADPIPPITAKSIFGPASPPVPADFGDDMNVDEDTLPTEPPPPLPITAPDLHPLPRHQAITIFFSGNLIPNCFWIAYICQEHGYFYAFSTLFHKPLFLTFFVIV